MATSPRRSLRSSSCERLSRRVHPARTIPVVVLAWCCVCLLPRPATADWLLTPFIGLKLDGQTNLVNVDQAAGKTKLTVGGSIALLADAPFGLEMDLGYS